MLKIIPDPTFTAPVKLTIPGQDVPGEVSLTFAYLSRTQLAAFIDLSKERSDAESLRALIVGWDGIDVAYDPEQLDRLLDHYPAASKEIFNAYIRLLTDSRVKN